MTLRSKTDLTVRANALLPDNTTRQISPADVRNMIIDIIDSLAPAVYGAMYITDAAVVIATTVQDAWRQITGFAQHTVGGITYAANALTVPFDGAYRVGIDISFEGDVNDIYEAAIYINGVIDAHHKLRRKTANNDVGNASFNGIFDLTANQIITVYVRNLDATPNAMTIIDCNVVVNQVS